MNLLKKCTLTFSIFALIYYSFAQSISDNYDCSKSLPYKGHYIKFSRQYDSHLANISLVSSPQPQSIDNQIIYTLEKLDKESATAIHKTIKKYMEKSLSASLAHLEDGQYRLRASSIIIDTKGSVVWFDFDSLTIDNYDYIKAISIIEKHGNTGMLPNDASFRLNTPVINAKVKTMIDKSFLVAMNNCTMPRPALYKGNVVYAREYFDPIIKVSNNKVSFHYL